MSSPGPAHYKTIIHWKSKNPKNKDAIKKNYMDVVSSGFKPTVYH
jgi:hypothetical protein